MNATFLSNSPITRRYWAERVAQAALGVTLLPHLVPAAEEIASPSRAIPGFGKAKQVIWLQMIGGMSHIDTLDPKTGESQGARPPIATPAGYQLGATCLNWPKIIPPNWPSFAA